MPNPVEIVGTYRATPPTFSEGPAQILTDSSGRLISAESADTVTLTKAAVTMTGSSDVLVAASATRAVVLVSNASANAAAAVDPTGGTAALDAGIAIPPGQTVSFTGKAAQSAMTQIGTNTQNLTVYTG